MKMHDGSLLIVIVIFVTAVVIGMGSTYFFGDDNEVEEVAEEVIQADTGMKIDLSPARHQAPAKPAQPH